MRESLSMRCTFRSNANMSCSLLLEKGTRVTDSSGMPTPIFHICISLDLIKDYTYVDQGAEIDFCVDFRLTVTVSSSSLEVEIPWQPERST